MPDHDGVVAVVNVSRSWPEVRAGARAAQEVVLGDWNPFKGNRPPQMAFDPAAVTTVFGYCKGFLVEVFDIDPDNPYLWLQGHSPARIRWNALPSSRWEKLRDAPSPISWRQGEGMPVKFLTLADLEAGIRFYSSESVSEDWPKFVHWHLSTCDDHGNEVDVTSLEQLIPKIWLPGQCDADKLRAFRWLANWHPAPQELKAEAEAFLASGYPDLESFLTADERAAMDLLPALEGLARRAFEVWEQARSQDAAAACAAMPILFFGDFDAYMRSPLRVITVGLNPSNAEFPDDPEKFPGQDRFWRFREAEGLEGLASTADLGRYIRALSSYFDNKPYKWFGTYKGLLEGMDASFYKGAASSALHTDLCSAVATHPTWSRLPEESRAVLLGPGRALWHDLVRVLRPQVMLISVAREHLGHILFESDAGWEEQFQVEREPPYQDHPYIVEHKRMRLEDGTPMLAVFGRAANTPFGTVSQKDQRWIGRRVKEMIHV
jgi:hypothetical protein